ncbi:pentatricopeptide repeat-containing protein mitochondrial-like, partial [Trifolium medium]|nr:pentatricopeptide repeat-containing protein mitochondrial-like [Trifolium medium]
YNDKLKQSGIYPTTRIFTDEMKVSDALVIYEEIKKAGHNLNPKDVISLIDALSHKSGELERLLLLLKDFDDLDNWADGCCSIIMYCVQNNHLRFDFYFSDRNLCQ